MVSLPFSIKPSFCFHSFLRFSSIPFLFNVADLIHLISSLLILITSLYLLSFSINLDSILCSMYYDLSISFPYLSLITNLSCYSISFSAYSYPVSSIPIHIVGSHFSIRHRTQLLISIHFHINTPYPLPSFILSQFYSSIHIVLSVIPFSPLHPPSLLYSILIHLLILILSPYSSSTHHSSHSFLSTSSSLSHSILIPSFIHFHFNTTLLYSSSSLFYKSLFDSILSFYSILLFVPRLPSITILLLLLLLLTPLSTIILFHTHSHTLHSVHSLLSYLSFFLLEPSSLPFLFIPLLSISFNHFFHHIINHFLLLFPSHFNHSSFNKHNNQIST